MRQVIDQEFARINPDLLVIGTHGRTGITHAFLGSVAEDLLCHPPADVLAVKARLAQIRRPTLLARQFSAVSLGSIGFARVG